MCWCDIILYKGMNTVHIQPRVCMRYSEYPMREGTRHNLVLEPGVIYEGHCLTDSDTFHML